MGDPGLEDDARHLDRRRFILLSASAVAGLAVGGCAARREGGDGPGPRLVTTLGDLAMPDAGIILPHEHVFLDSRLPSDPQHARARIEDVVEVMRPELEQARAAGVAVLVDAGAVGLGRRADITAAVSRAARLPVLLPTGLYCDQSTPRWARAASEEQPGDWMQGEMIRGIDGTRVQAGWIKLCATDGGLTEHGRRSTHRRRLPRAQPRSWRSARQRSPTRCRSRPSKLPTTARRRGR
jgi:hypothetical protein